MSRDTIVMYNKQREKNLKQPYRFLAYGLRLWQVYHLKALEILLLVVPLECELHRPKKDTADQKSVSYAKVGKFGILGLN